MPALKYKVELTEAERSHLKKLVRGGKVSAHRFKRALTLLNADEGLSDLEIAGALKIGLSTVSRVRRRFVQEGLESALNERARPGQKRKLSGKQEAHLMAIACSEPPKGHTHWTLKLPAGKVVELGFAEDSCLETVRQTLKKTNSSRGRTSNGASRK